MNRPKPLDIVVPVEHREVLEELRKILGGVAVRLHAVAGDALLSCPEPDVLVADGRGDGLGLCRRLHLDPATADLPVLLAGPGWDGTWVEQVYAAGAADYLSWPLRPPEVLGRIGAQAELTRARRRMQAAEGLDAETGLPGAARFNAILDQEWRRVERDGNPLAILVAAIDGFDQYSAVHGSGAATACLSAVAQTLVAAVARASDQVAHLGNAQYGCVLPDTDVPGALSVAQRMLDLTRALRLPSTTPSQGSRVTLSVGFAASFTTQLLGPEELLFRARRNLERAYRRGGDRWSAGEEDA